MKNKLPATGKKDVIIEFSLILASSRGFRQSLRQGTAWNADWPDVLHWYLWFVSKPLSLLFGGLTITLWQPSWQLVKLPLFAYWKMTMVRRDFFHIGKSKWLD